MDFHVKCANCGLEITRSAINRNDMCLECESLISSLVDAILDGSKSGAY